MEISGRSAQTEMRERRSLHSGRKFYVKYCIYDIKILQQELDIRAFSSVLLIASQCILSRYPHVTEHKVTVPFQRSDSLSVDIMPNEVLYGRQTAALVICRCPTFLRHTFDHPSAVN